MLYVYCVATPLGSLSWVSWSSAFQAWAAAVMPAKAMAVLRRWACSGGVFFSMTLCAVPAIGLLGVAFRMPVGSTAPNALYGHCHTDLFCSSVISLGLPRWSVWIV